MTPKFKVDDEVRIRRVETSPGQFAGQSGVRGTITEVGELPMGVQGATPELYHTVMLHWPTGDREESFPESWFEVFTNDPE